MNASDMELVQELKRGLPLKILEHVRGLVVFGSRARGTADSESDLDALFLVDECDRVIEEGVKDVAYDIMIRHNFKPVFSIKMMEEYKYKKYLKEGFSFYQAVDREGIWI